MSDLLLIGGNNRSLWANRGDPIADLLAAGVDVRAALPPKESIRYPPLRPIPIPRIAIERTGMNPLRELAAVPAVRRLVARLRPAVVLAYNPKPVIFSGWALALFPDVGPSR